MTAANIGRERTPVGIGWHPYFHLPSGDRAQARLRIAAERRLVVDNYQSDPYTFVMKGAVSH